MRKEAGETQGGERREGLLVDKINLHLRKDDLFIHRHLKQRIVRHCLSSGMGVNVKYSLCMFLKLPSISFNEKIELLSVDVP